MEGRGAQLGIVIPYLRQSILLAPRRQFNPVSPPGRGVRGLASREISSRVIFGKVAERVMDIKGWHRLVVTSYFLTESVRSTEYFPDNQQQQRLPKYAPVLIQSEPESCPKLGTNV